MTNERKSEPEKGLANDKFLLDEVGNRIPLSEVKAGTRLRFSQNPEYADGSMSDPNYIDDNAPITDEVRTVRQYSPVTDYIELDSTSTKGTYNLRLAAAQKSARITG